MFKNSYIRGAFGFAMMAAFVIAIPNATNTVLADTCTTPQLTITSSKQVNGTVGVALTYDIALSSNVQNVQYDVGGIPPGVKVNADPMQLVGTPTTAGNYSIKFTASNSCGTSSDTLKVTIAAATTAAATTAPAASDPAPAATTAAATTAAATTVGLNDIPSTGFDGQSVLQIVFYMLSLVLAGGFVGYLFYKKNAAETSTGHTLAVNPSAIDSEEAEKNTAQHNRKRSVDGTLR